MVLFFFFFLNYLRLAFPSPSLPRAILNKRQISKVIQFSTHLCAKNKNNHVSLFFKESSQSLSTLLIINCYNYYYCH